MTDDELGLRKLNTPKLVAPTLKGDKEITYELLLHEDGSLYIQVTENTGAGSLSKYRFQVKSVRAALDANDSVLRGIALDGITQDDNNLNSIGFVQAAVKHLLADSNQGNVSYDPQ